MMNIKKTLIQNMLPLVLSIIFFNLNSCTEKKEVFSSNMEFTMLSKSAIVFTTAKDTNLRLSETGVYNFTKSEQPLETENSIFVNPNSRFQTFIGIGGAITDASAEVFAKLSSENQENLLEAYYGKGGIDYTLMRTPIHSCDFSSGSFTYIEEGDAELKTFNIDHDRKFRLPMIKRAIEKAKGSMLFYASPWSPPAFMKSSKNMLQGGKLLPEYYDAWARYYVKFIDAYEAEGIPVWGITIQNEPMATQPSNPRRYCFIDGRDSLRLLIAYDLLDWAVEKSKNGSG